jgi:hypothetical protein
MGGPYVFRYYQKNNMLVERQLMLIALQGLSTQTHIMNIPIHIPATTLTSNQLGLI